MMMAVIMGIMMVGMVVVVVLIAAASLVAAKSRLSPEPFDPFDEKPKRGRIVVTDDGEWAFEEKPKRQ